MEFDFFTMNNCTKIFLGHVLSLQLYVRRFREYFWGNSFRFPWKNDGGGVLKKNVASLSHPSLSCSLWPSYTSPGETLSILVSPWEACFAVRYFCKCRFLGLSWPSASSPVVADPRIFIFVNSFFGGRVSRPQVLRTTSPVQLSLASIMSDETNIMQCSFRSALLLKNRLLVGQNRLSPCKWGVKGHNFMGSHLSLSQRHFRLVVCLHW